MLTKHIPVDLIYRIANLLPDLPQNRANYYYNLMQRLTDPRFFDYPSWKLSEFTGWPGVPQAREDWESFVKGFNGLLHARQLYRQDHPLKEWVTAGINRETFDSPHYNSMLFKLPGPVWELPRIRQLGRERFIDFGNSPNNVGIYNLRWMKETTQAYIYQARAILLDLDFRFWTKRIGTMEEAFIFQHTTSHTEIKFLGLQGDYFIFDFLINGKLSPLMCLNQDRRGYLDQGVPLSLQSPDFPGYLFPLEALLYVRNWKRVLYWLQEKLPEYLARKVPQPLDHYGNPEEVRIKLKHMHRWEHE